MDLIDRIVKAGMLALFLSVGGLGLAGCDDGPFEETGEEVDEAGEEIRDGADEIEDEVDR